MAVIALPEIIQMPVAGCSPLIFTPEDFTSDRAWYEISKKRSPWLEEKDFNDYNLFTKYFLATLGLLDYPMCLICGQEGEGKSLVMAWLAYKLVNLFGKRCTLDWTPPKPELFGHYFSLYDEDFTEKIQTELNRIARLGSKPPREELEKLIIFNTVFALDEGDSYGDKASRTNLTKLIGRIIRRRRHFHAAILMAFVDPADADTRLIFNRRSHEISCGRNVRYLDTCSYLIHNRRTGIYKHLHLRPADCAELWDSFNVVSISHDVDVRFGARKPKKKEKKEEEW